MAKTKRQIIFATFIISCLSTILSIVSISTQEWVIGDLKPTIAILDKADFYYGLFKGSLSQKYLISNSKDYNLIITCIFGENICGYSFQEKSEDREMEIENIFNGKYCEKNILTYKEDDDNNDFTIKCDKTFINSGLWIITIFFLSLSIIMSAVTATLSVINTAGNPISPWLNIWGLYIWNGLSSIFSLFTLIFWGALFGSSIQKNAAVSPTLIGSYSNDDVSLGYSYWMIFAPLFLHIINCGLFYWRQYLIEKEPEISEEKIENANRDGSLFIY